MTERLATKQNIEAIHIISHGSPGSVQLGANTLNSSNIESFGPQLKQWRKALIPGADILLYGCNVATDVSVTTDIDYIRHISEELTPLSRSLSRLKLTSCTILKNRQDACEARKFTLGFTGILPVHKKLIGRCPIEND